MQTISEMILMAEDLPTPPGVALRLLELYGKPCVEVREMAAVIGTDPVLTARLIQYCNSPLLSRENKTTSVERAIVVIGMRAVKILALSFSLVRTASNNANLGFDYDEFWSKSLATAVVAKTIGATQNRNGSEEFLIGLMLKMGLFGLAHTFPSRYAELCQQSKETGIPVIQLEQDEWNSNHLEIGTDLLSHWNFPEKITVGLKAYAEDQIAMASDPDAEPQSTQGKILALTEQIVSILFAPDPVPEEVESARSMADKLLGLESSKFVEMFDQATSAWSQYAVLLNFDASHAQTFDQLERRARKGIAQLSIGLHAENTVICQENAELKINATIDSLTGLKNRRAYDEEAVAEWERSARMNRPFVLMMVDIDHFKQVNDKHGHGVGDRTLVAVGKALRSNARQYDAIYRFGGEEFVVMVPECLPSSAHPAAERYRKAIESIEIQLDSQTLKITASIGVAVHAPGTKGSLNDLLNEADTLLYQAKNAGRNRVCGNCDATIAAQ